MNPAGAKAPVLSLAALAAILPALIAKLPASMRPTPGQTLEDLQRQQREMLSALEMLGILWQAVPALALQLGTSVEAIWSGPAESRIPQLSACMNAHLHHVSGHLEDVLRTIGRAAEGRLKEALGG